MLPNGNVMLPFTMLLKLYYLLVAETCRNRTHPSTVKPTQTVLKTAETTRPHPLPLAVVWYSSIPSQSRQRPYRSAALLALLQSHLVVDNFLKWRLRSAQLLVLSHLMYV